MRKFFTYFSLTIILIVGLYAAKDLATYNTANPTYNGVAQFIVDKTVSETRALNSVTAIVFDFRGYDTIGESIVLLTAISGSAVILRKELKGR